MDTAKIPCGAYDAYIVIDPIFLDNVRLVLSDKSKLIINHKGSANIPFKYIANLAILEMHCRKNHVVERVMKHFAVLVSNICIETKKKQYYTIDFRDETADKAVEFDRENNLVKLYHNEFEIIVPRDLLEAIHDELAD